MTNFHEVLTTEQNQTTRASWKKLSHQPVLHLHFMLMNLDIDVDGFFCFSKPKNHTVFINICLKIIQAPHTITLNCTFSHL